MHKKTVATVQSLLLSAECAIQAAVQGISWVL